MNQKELKSEIDNKNLRNLYIFCSDDYFLKKTYRDRIVKSGGYDLEIMDIEEKDEIRKVSELANSTKLFGTSNVRVIYAKIHYALSKIEIDNKSNNIIILDPIECKNIKHKNLVRFSNPKEDEIKKFIAYKLSQDNKKIEKKAVEFIYQKFKGQEAFALNIFLDKVLLYDKNEQIITYKDVVLLDDGVDSVNIFHIAEYILQNDKEKFFQEIDSALTLVHPSALISIIANEAVKTVALQYVGNEDLTNFGIKTNYAYKYKAYFNTIGKGKIVLLFDILYDMDYMLKSLSDKGFAELFKTRMFEWFNEKQ